MLLEAGERQPRSLAEAYCEPCAPRVADAIEALASHLAALDNAYATGEERHLMTLSSREMPGAKRGSLADLASWAEGLPGAALP